MLKGLELFCHGDRLRGLGVFNMQKGSFQQDLTAAFHCLKAGRLTFYQS